MASVLCFFLVGFLLLLPVKEPPHAAVPIVTGLRAEREGS
jgi:hypothetical protein